MPGRFKDRLKELLECFYERHIEKVAWVFVAALWTLIVSHGELWRWRWTTVDPVLTHILSDHNKREGELSAIDSRLRAVEGEVSRIEGHLDAEKQRSRYGLGGL